MSENEELNDTQNSGFIPEILIIEQLNDEYSESESKNGEGEEEEEIFSELESSTELAENISDSELYDNLEIALNMQRRMARPQQNNNFRKQQVNSSCCLFI